MPTNDDGSLTAFSASTPNPKTYAHDIDNTVLRSMTPYAYRDRNNQDFLVMWTGTAWGAVPTKSAVEYYKAPPYNLQMDTKRQFAVASDAASLIDAVEAFTTEHPSSFPWWLLVVGYLLLKGKRR